MAIIGQKSPALGSSQPAGCEPRDSTVQGTQEKRAAQPLAGMMLAHHPPHSLLAPGWLLQSSAGGRGETRRVPTTTGGFLASLHKHPHPAAPREQKTAFHFSNASEVHTF